MIIFLNVGWYMVPRCHHCQNHIKIVAHFFFHLLLTSGIGFSSCVQVHIDHQNLDLVLLCIYTAWSKPVKIVL